MENNAKRNDKIEANGKKIERLEKVVFTSTGMLIVGMATLIYGLIVQQRISMQLSKHFKLEEFTKSMTATRKGIDNNSGSGDIKNLENVCYEILEPVRAKFDRPVT